ncbi:aldo/keto reductase [Streptomyces canus]|uniref:aldo/keto reductase n=1 Tax=Streptomyces canus TaxID=58343 RepID=UPI00324DA8DD
MTPPHGDWLAEPFEALAALWEEGLIRHLGLSNVDTDHLVEARAIAPVVAVQNQFHAAKRHDAELLSACEEADIAFVPLFPLGGRRELDDERLAKVAARHGVAVSQIGLAWLPASSPVTLAIPGTGSPTHLEDTMAVAGISLGEEDLADLS